MAYDANGNYIPDNFNTTGFNLGSMSQWGNPVGNQFSNSMGGVQSGSGFGQQGFDVNQINPTAGQTSSIWDTFLSSKDASGSFQQGWGTPAIQGIGTLANSWLGFQGLGVARDQLNQNRDQWNQQFALQKEEYDYQKQQRAQREANYEATYGSGRASASTPTTNRVVGNPKL